jgi:hypothetical protein
MPKETANFTALGQRFLVHYEGGATIAVYPMTAEAFALTCEQEAPLPPGVRLYSQSHKVLMEIAQQDSAERLAAIYRGAREALGWDRDEWRGRIPNDDPPQVLVARAGA